MRKGLVGNTAHNERDNTRREREVWCHATPVSGIMRHANSGRRSAFGESSAFIMAFLHSFF